MAQEENTSKVGLDFLLCQRNNPITLKSTKHMSYFLLCKVGENRTFTIITMGRVAG